MIVYVLTSWTFVVVIDFPWNIFWISVNFGQFVILCPFKPKMWHAYEDVFLIRLCCFYGCHYGLFLFFACFHIVISHSTICAILVSLPCITLCFWWWCLFSTL
jgi:hypothetical protein